jgi:YD repeat-containing protein
MMKSRSVGHMGLDRGFNVRRPTFNAQLCDHWAGCGSPPGCSSYGQVLTVKNALNETTPFDYDTSNYLKTITHLQCDQSAGNLWLHLCEPH